METGKEESAEDCLRKIKEWLTTQPHLPQKIDDEIIKRFTKCCRLDLEKCKKLIELNYTLRSQSPEIFANRDPLDVSMRNIFKAIDYCPLPKLTDKKYKIFIYRVADTDPDKFIFADTLKAFFMVADVRMYTDHEETEGEIPIFDMAGTSIRHLTRITIPLIRKYMVFTQESHPVRLKQIHIVNSAWFLDKCMALVRPFLKSEVARLLNFHTPNSSTLFEHIPKELLPEDYGGTLGIPITEIKKEWVDRVMKHREFFLDADRWNVDETKRAKARKSSEKNIFAFQETFRSLCID